MVTVAFRRLSFLAAPRVGSAPGNNCASGSRATATSSECWQQPQACLPVYHALLFVLESLGHRL